MRKYVAEFIGTFVLVLLGCGTAAAVGCKGSEVNAAYILTALAFGLSIVAMAYSIGNVSGCHVNPAVSLGVLMTGGMSVRDFIGYVIAQVLGAICGAAIIGVLLGWDCGFGANGLYQGDVMVSLLVEILLTFVFVMAVLGATSKIENAHVAGLVIGLSLTLVHILGIHFTGTSVNPARSIGPALFAGGAALSNLWVFIVAPLVGGALAAVVWNYLKGDKAAE
ncbi:MAG: aquaporin [Atopobiaceae bacterium]|jgi:aquaporin Z|nr:aquaporin [Atopobiaceae bacterium]MCI2173759.1 aquaporin [Atopobiaceae bacterium]MCI2207599.1 aquaporin [Atopobiaceae bacterium]